MPDFNYNLRIYWEDTDAGGIVYYANYLKFFERARTEWLRSLNIHQQKMREELNVLFVVSEAHVKYLHPAQLDDELLIITTIQHIGKASIVLKQQASKNNPNNELLCEAEVKIACVNALSMSSTRLPITLVTALNPV